MIKRIVLLNTWHNSFDDRVFYHQAKSLLEHGFKVIIISTKDDCIQEVDQICINSFNDFNLPRTDKNNEIINRLTDFSPDIIICDSPSAIFVSVKYQKSHNVRIIYDITEWYPSKIHLQYNKGIQKSLRFIVLILFNLIAGFKSDSFIFGEYYKSLIFRMLYFWKQHIKLPYYPDTNYIQYYPVEKITSEINLLYSGKINKDKGIDAVIESIKLAGINCPEIQFKLKIIGNFPTENDISFFNNLIADIPHNVHISITKSLPFPEFCKTIGNTHLFFDLRKIDFENTHCLPIKLFYYLACGRPVIYSNLKSIRKEIVNINFGKLFEPNDYLSIATFIEKCIVNKEFYDLQCKNALDASVNKYNWEIIQKRFFDFIESNLVIVTCQLHTKHE